LIAGMSAGTNIKTFSYDDNNISDTYERLLVGKYNLSSVYFSPK
jgi:hypothetical protein